MQTGSKKEHWISTLFLSFILILLFFFSPHPPLYQPVSPFIFASLFCLLFPVRFIQLLPKSHKVPEHPIVSLSILFTYFIILCITSSASTLFFFFCFLFSIGFILHLPLSPALYPLSTGTSRCQTVREGERCRRQAVGAPGNRYEQTHIE